MVSQFSRRFRSQRSYRAALRQLETLEPRMLMSSVPGYTPNFFVAPSGAYDTSGNLWFGNVGALTGGSIDRVVNGAVISATGVSGVRYQRQIELSTALSAREKLARFILDWSAHHPSETGPIRFNLTLTHEEIAQMIGASRETVTRLFGDFKKRNLLQVKGSSVTLNDKRGLEQLLQES